MLALAASACLDSRIGRAEINRWAGITEIGLTSPIIVDPSQPTTLYSGGFGGLRKTTDGGRSWTGGDSDQNHIILALAVSKSSPETIYRVDKNVLLVTEPQTLSRSDDGGETWTGGHYLPQIGISGYVSDLAVDPTNSDVLYASTVPAGLREPSSGIFKSTDGAASWSLVSGSDGTLYFASSVVIDPESPSTIYAGSSLGVHKSTDAGTTWTPMTSGLPDSTSLAVQKIVIDPLTPSTVYIATLGGVYKSTDAGEHWFRASQGLPQETVIVALAISPSSPSTLFANGRSGEVFESKDGGDEWESLSTGLPSEDVTELSIDPLTPTSIYAGTRDQILKLTQEPEGPCQAGTAVFCARGNRFRVQVNWQALHLGSRGLGKAVPLTEDTGAFWFFTNTNLELAVKVVDGRPFNGEFWVFYGALSNVQYSVTVSDTQTRVVRSYGNRQDLFGSLADVNAFDAGTEAATANSVGSPGAISSSGCSGDASTLCLHGGRFRVKVDWDAENIGKRGTGIVVPLTSDTGAFWFFSDNNIELVIKVVDGRPVNDHFWVFYGALSNIQYTITVTDTETGTVKTYDNPQGTLASATDTKAF